MAESNFSIYEFPFHDDSSDQEMGNFDLGFLSDVSDQEANENMDILLHELDNSSESHNEVTSVNMSDPSNKAPTFINDFTEASAKGEFVEKMRNANTVRKTESVIKIFRRWLNAAPYFETRVVTSIPPTELDNYIGSFLLSLRKHDGSEYEPDTLTSYHRGIDRYLRENGSLYSLVFDREFRTSRDILASKRKELKQKGKGNRLNKSQPLTENEEKILYEKGVVGNNSPQALLNKVWLMNTMQFGLRGTDENRKLKWGDLNIKCDERGVEYVEFNERDTKTRSGEHANSHIRSFNPKQFALPGDKEHCPVEAYKAYRDHRPIKMCAPDSPFYLAINYQRKSDSNTWYKCQPLGQNSLKIMLKKMANRAELPGHKTNHSVRKTTCTRLLHAGVAPTTIMQLTGHKNVASINNYATASHAMQERLSNILAVPTCPSTSECIVRAPSPVPGTSHESESAQSLHHGFTDDINDENMPPQLTSVTLSQPSSCHAVNNTCNKYNNNTLSQMKAGIFQGATFNNCTININFGHSKTH